MQDYVFVNKDMAIKNSDDRNEWCYTKKGDGTTVYILTTTTCSILGIDVKKWNIQKDVRSSTSLQQRNGP